MARRARKVLQLLLPRVRDKETDFRIRMACVRVGVLLRADDPEFAREAGQTLSEQLARTTDIPALLGLTEVFQGLVVVVIPQARRT